MENVVQFYVDDTSPVISYSPFGDTFTTPNLGAGWNPYFNLSGFAASIGEVGNGTSLHITSLNGASLGFQWRGSAIQLQGNVTLASYSITIDGQTIPMANQTDIDNNILANIEGLEDADHNITLTAQIPEGQNPPNSSMLVFDKAVITSTPIPVSSNVSFRLDTIQDNDISFRGRWSFVNTSTGVSVHSSSTAGDRALTTFNGTTFLLRGMTSPDAAEYSVNLDNVTTTYSARSSFTDNESLLFFASGLDQNSLHSIEVRNLNGGDLSLLVGGFSTFISYKRVFTSYFALTHKLILSSSSSSPPPSATSSATTLPSTSGSSSSMSFSKGTIAAFILAGILAFLLITAVLLFFLWYRPRMRRRRYECRLATTRFDQSPSKAHEAGGVINISTAGEPNYDKAVDLEDASPVEDDRRHSQLSGFARWRREAVHGSFGGVSLPLHFRHSDSANGKSRTHHDTIEERPRSEMSDPPSTESSARRKARAKSKGKARQITGRSWSPSYTLDLPLQQKSTTRASNGQASARVPTSVGQLSSFVAAEPSPQDLRNPAPPSYAASVSNQDSIRNSNMSGTNTNPSSSIPSGPRSVSYSPVIADYPTTSHHHHRHQPHHQPHHRDNSNGFLLHEGEPSSDPESPGNDYPHLQLTPPEPEGIPMRPLARYDTGSLTTEDNPSIIEPSAMREVLRTLSPRTSEAPRLSEWHDDDDNQTSLIASPITIASSTPPPDVQPTSEQSQTQTQPKPKIKPLPRPPIQTKADEDEVEVRDGVFLSVRATSPFRVDFDSRSASQHKAAASDETSDMYTTASSDRNPSRQSSGLRRLPEPSGAAGTAMITRIPEFIQGTSRLPFRLTPMAFPTTQTPPKQSSDGTSDGVTSFLDLTSSREGSLRSRSIRTGTAGSELDRPMNEARLSVPGVGVMEPKSRWSNTTVPSIATNLAPPAANNNNTSSGESQHYLSPSDARSTDSSTFPIAVQVDIPPSPHHVMDFAPNRQSDTSRRTSGFTQAGDSLHIHPALEGLESPTESIPMSVSEVHFRHSDSEDASPSTQARPNVDPQSSSFHPTHPPLPGSQGEEYTPRPFDPSVLVSRVLGLSSTAPSVDLSRSGSTAVPPSASTHTLPPRSNPNTSNDQLNPSDKPGHPFS